MVVAALVVASPGAAADPIHVGASTAALRQPVQDEVAPRVSPSCAASTSLVAGCESWIHVGGGANRLEDMQMSINGRHLFVATLDIDSGLTRVEAVDREKGEPVWSVELGGSEGGLGERGALRPTPDGKQVMVVRHVVPLEGPEKVVLDLLDAADGSTGAQVELARPDLGLSNLRLREAFIRPDAGRIVLMWLHFASPSTYAAAVSVHDPTDGTTLWAGGPWPGLTWESVYSGDGERLFVSLQAQVSGQWDYRTFAFHAENGTLIWSSDYAGRGTGLADGPREMTLARDGSRLYVSGFTEARSGIWDWGTIAYDAATGTVLWTTRFGIGSFFAQPDTLAVAPDDSRLYVGGGLAWGGDTTVIAYDTATGTQLWRSDYSRPGGGIEFNTELLATADGLRLLAVGTHVNTGSAHDYTTMALNGTNGAREWVAHFNASVRDDDIAYRALLGPDESSIYVAGLSRLPGSVQVMVVSYPVVGPVVTQKVVPLIGAGCDVDAQGNPRLQCGVDAPRLELGCQAKSNPGVTSAECGAEAAGQRLSCRVQSAGSQPLRCPD
ncbi:MAG: PQQ-binding-like beta-propeller repeat protein [Euryarchaeota archaeon]|nr:PQQ-binding-like beta-propeller repeat protein [Euryarchaeota archaeon]